jgi:T-complex protein 1 subunit beta
MIKKVGGKLTDSYLDEGSYLVMFFPSYVHSTHFLLGFILDKTIAVNSPKRMENVKILIANTCRTYFVILIWNLMFL